MQTHLSRLRSNSELQEVCRVHSTRGKFTALVLISLTWSFVLLFRYNNSFGRVIINSYFIGFTHFVRTIMMALLMMSPMALILIYPAATPIILVIGITLPCYLQTFFFIKVFEDLKRHQTAGENAQA